MSDWADKAVGYYFEDGWTSDVMRRRCLAAALREAATPRWQPIETAPKDGSRVLLWSRDFGDLVHDTDAVEFPGGRPPTPAFASLKWVYEGMWSDRGFDWYSYNGYQFLTKPTQWMPLPEPPKGDDR